MKYFLTAFFIVIAAAPSFAETAPQKTSFNQAQMDLLNNAQDYLAKVRTVHANFIQINPGTTAVSSGEIFISKPGRLKMSYANPFKIDYYINDDNLTQYDHDLDEVTRGEAPENPLKVLLYDDVTLARNDIMTVSNIEDEGSTYNIYMLNKANKIRDISGLILKFRKSPIELLSIMRVDYEGNKTETNLTAVEINKDIDDSEFVFKKAKPAYPGSRKTR